MRLQFFRSVFGPLGAALLRPQGLPSTAFAGMADVVLAPPTRRRRLTTKTNLQTFCLWSLLPEEEQGGNKAVYLVTLAHPSSSHSAEGIQLVTPASFDRAAASQKLLAACARPRPDPPWARTHPEHDLQGVGVERMAVFREYHATNAEAILLAV